jgi:glycosyltransferase involved in cell wall biosynthesis
LCSTNGYDNFPKDLEENVVCRNCTKNENRIVENCKLGKGYDLSLSYTMMKNFPFYLDHSEKNRFGIWNYDGTNIPPGYSKYYKYATKVLPSSKFSYDTFAKSGVPESAMVIVPHGYGDEFVDRNDIYNLTTHRKIKILVNIQQNHIRKNMAGILEAWGRAFTDKDDVIMIAKVNMKKPTQPFEASWNQEMLKMKKKYKNHAPILIINDFIDYMSDLYRACDIVFSASNVECFHFPSLEGLVSNKIVIASNWGGNVDFMNNKNSLLINGKVGRAPANMQYWSASLFGECFYPDIEHAAELLQYAVNNYESLKQQFSPEFEKIRQEYNWRNVVNKILSLCE